MSNQNVIRINTGLLIFALTALAGVAVAWGTIIAELRGLQGIPTRVILQGEQILGLERRMTAVERKNGMAAGYYHGDVTGSPFVADRKPNDK